MPKLEGEAFLFYFERWRGSRPVQRMTFGERGIFLEMLIEQWMRGDLPDDPRAIADAIATSDAQVGEIEAAWPAMRRQFITVERADHRIQNLALERVRRTRRAQLRKNRESGREGGKRSVAKRQARDELSLKGRLSDPQPIKEVKEEKYKESKEREIPRTRASVFEGSLPREHRDHVFCDPSFSICVPAAVHAKFIGPYARRCGGDREVAHDQLCQWYAKTAEALAADYVMGDAFKFWQPRFDAAFATADPTTVSNDAAWDAAIKAGPSVRRNA